MGEARDGGATDRDAPVATATVAIQNSVPLFA